MVMFMTWVTTWGAQVCLHEGEHRCKEFFFKVQESCDYKTACGLCHGLESQVESMEPIYIYIFYSAKSL